MKNDGDAQCSSPECQVDSDILSCSPVIGAPKKKEVFVDDQRIESHPILQFEKGAVLSFTFDGRPMEGREGDTVASALFANGVQVFGRHYKTKRARGFYCAIGNCSSCLMVVNGKPNVRTCTTYLEEGMVVETQEDRGILSRKQQIKHVIDESKGASDDV
jgi:hypothetical protein